MTNKLFFLISFLFLCQIKSLAQSNVELVPSGKKNIFGVNIGAGAFEGLFSQSGLNIEYFYHRKLNKRLYVGIDQGFLVQDNFPSNFYPTNTAPFHLAPEIDAYIRSLGGDAFGLEWKKTFNVYLSPYIGVQAIQINNLAIGLHFGIGLQYRSSTRFSVISIARVANQLVDYKERLTTNTAINPMINSAIFISRSITPTFKVQLNFKFVYELASINDLENTGPADFMALRLGFSKLF